MDRFTLQVPGSVSNLGPGFDTLGLAVQLYLKVRVKSHWDGRRRITYSGLGAHILKDVSENLIEKAIHMTWQSLGFERIGYEMEVQNEIPIAAGLGSSAAAVAAGIEIACRLSRKRLTLSEKIQLGYRLEGHPDNIIPSFVGGFIIALMSGEKSVNWVRYMFPRTLKIVIVTPEFSVATRSARDALPQEFPREDVVFNLQRLAGLIGAITTGKWEDELGLMSDQIHQPYRAHLVPGLTSILEIPHSSGLLGVALSGSGPSIVALIRGKGDEIGKEIVQQFAKAGYRSTARILNCDHRGARFLTSKRKG